MSTDAPMEVAVVIQSFRPVLGGAQRQVEQLAPLLAEHGVRLDVITRRVNGAPPDEVVGTMHVRRVGAGGRGAWSSGAYTVGGARAVRRMRPDLIHVHDLLSPASIGLLAARRHTPMVAKVLAAGPDGDLARLATKPLGRPRLRRLLRRVDAFVCVSDEVERELLDAGASPDRLVRIPNGVDTRRFRPVANAGRREQARIAYGLPTAPIALFCGRFAEAKRLDVLVCEIAATSMHLVLAGEGPERDHVLAVARDRGIAGRVHLVDTARDPAELYRAADVYVSASRQEGLSNAVLEAMASGLPVVGVRAPGMAELLGDGAGVLVEPGAPAALGAAMERLARDEDGRRWMGERARARVRERYALAMTADALATLYRRLIP